MLNKASKADADANLLSPTGNWHGMQPYNFTSRDLAHGAERSVLGADRTMTIGRLGIVVRVKILAAEVAPLPDDVVQRLRLRTPQVEHLYELKDLRLAVSVENSSEIAAPPRQ
jgi:hypothetical protein